MHAVGPVRFFRRAFPSANMALVVGSRPVLVDCGFGSEVEGTIGLLRTAGLPPERLHLLVHSHYHSDHVGGTNGLQKRFQLPVAAHRWDAAMVNQRDPEACAARWLDQPVEPYWVDRSLADGDEIDAGGIRMQVVHTPGHTLGHISLYLPEHRLLIAGDAVHADDVAWINMFREGAGALERAMASLDRLAGLRAIWACSGHGPAIGDPLQAIDRARRRYDGWLRDTERLGWHACKRIFAYALMLEGGLDEGAVAPYLRSREWFQDFSRKVFSREPEEFVDPLVGEMLRSGAAGWDTGRLVARTAHNVPPPGWASAPTQLIDWPLA